MLAALERRVVCDTATPTGCCAAAREEPSCCAAATCESADSETPDACDDYRSLAAAAVPSPEPHAEGVDEASGTRVVILRDMLACGGILTAWLACGAALPPPRVAPPGHDAPAGALALDDVVAPSVSADPATPPPRVG